MAIVLFMASDALVKYPGGERCQKSQSNDSTK
jgi:hypothetical protein